MRLTKFITESWMDTDNRNKLGNISLFFTIGEECIELTQDDVNEVESLTSS